MEMWVSWAGFPKIVTSDRGLHNRGHFSRGLANNGVFQRQAALESPEMIGRGERHGGIIKRVMKRMVNAFQASEKYHMKLIGAIAQMEKNEAVKRGGFSPSQWVLGKAPRGVGHLLDEDELGHLGALHATEPDAAGDFAIRSK